ncbi:aminopeptidase P N-terminal domain-containing protein [Baaleninema sp.]|uniref:aminopeptidase P N-terminal domain-containing protein n=1 Tax=Baaleninema sp. TaxID=3101197 RepID=UPI003D007E7E
MQHLYAQRRNALLEKLNSGTAIFRSAPMAVMHNDVEYAFRQDSDFFYLTGFNEPNAVAVFAPHHEEHQFVLFVEPKDLEKEIWTGYRTGVEAAKEKYGADEAFSIEELDEKLPEYLQNADRIYYRLGRDEGFNNCVIQHWRKLLATYAKRGTGPVALEDPSPILHSMRLVKTPEELDLMRKAAKIAVEAHNLAVEVAKPGRYEYEVQAEMERVFALHGGSPAYPSIVASGGNACILHYVENRRQMKDGDLLLIDAGCSYGYYNSDITRTFPVGGEFTPEQQAIYDIVLEAQKQAIACVLPGTPYNEYHDVAVRVIVEGLLDLGLLSGDLDEIIEEEKYKPFYMHKTGHWLGLDVHDVGTYKQDEESWQILQPGNVLTVEPGIYISPYVKPVEGQPEVDAKWHGIGVRIEDDVLVTEEGCEVLTEGVPK